MYKTISEKGVDSFAELVFLGGDDENTSIVGARKFIASLYDPKGKEKVAHSNMNVLHAKLAAKRECVLAKMPPCEKSLKQHVRRAAWQTRIWISSHIAKPDHLTRLCSFHRARHDGASKPLHLPGEFNTRLTQCQYQLQSTLPIPCNHLIIM